VGSLTANWHTSSVPDALIRTDFDLAANVAGDLTAQVTLNSVITLYELANSGKLNLTKVFHSKVGVNACRLESGFSPRVSDPVDGGESHLDTLLIGYINPDYACHVSLAFACDEGSHRSPSRDRCVE